MRILLAKDEGTPASGAEAIVFALRGALRDGGAGFRCRDNCQTGNQREMEYVAGRDSKSLFSAGISTRE
jgi:hypothetical protein